MSTATIDLPPASAPPVAVRRVTGGLLAAWGLASTDVDDVVLWNERGEITETTIANLAVELDGTWCTPPLGCGLLPGVERERLIEDGTLVERVLSIADLRRARSIAVLNSLRGRRPAQLVTDEEFPAAEALSLHPVPAG